MGGGGEEPVTEGSQLTPDEQVMVHIKCSNGSKFSVQTNLDITVGSFKLILAQNCDTPSEQQRLIYKGRILKDDQTLKSYGLEADHTIHMVRGFPPAASATPDPSGGANQGGADTVPSLGRGLGSDESGALGGSGFGDLLFPGIGLNAFGSGGGLYGAELTELEEAQRLAQNPNMMREMANLPAIQNLMSNPDLLRNLIMSNPLMRQIIDRNPELAHILNDPNILRQTFESVRNPELMREMMRNTDRAMSNIESSPEGFNMLRRMYENVQEPLLNAATMHGNTDNDSASNPFAALLGTLGRGQNLDRSTNYSNTNSDVTGSPAPNTNPLPNPWSSAGTAETGAGGAQPDTTRTNSARDTRQLAPDGLGGSGLPQFGRMFGAMSDSTSLNQLMQNPAISQMMQNLLSNPQLMNQITNINPQMRSMFDSSSQLRQIMENPEFLRQLSSPESMQQLLTLQQSLLSQLGRQQATEEPGQTDGGTGRGNGMGLEMLMNIFGGVGSGSLNVPSRSNVPPEELYATQLSQLQEMGFFDTRENIQALIATAGNVHAAVERLLGNPGQ